MTLSIRETILELYDVFEVLGDYLTCLEQGTESRSYPNVK